MRKVILSIFVTLDGFISGPNGEMDCVLTDQEMQNYGNHMLDSVDALLLGRVAYQLFVQHWPTAPGASAEKLNSLPKIVFSKTLDKVEWGKWDNARLVKDHIVEEIESLKQQFTKDLVIFAGAGIAAALKQLDLIDEYQLLVHPTILGSGKPLFKQGTAPLNLNLIRADTFKNGVVVLYYQPTK